MHEGHCYRSLEVWTARTGTNTGPAFTFDLSLGLFPRQATYSVPGVMMQGLGCNEWSDDMRMYVKYGEGAKNGDLEICFGHFVFHGPPYFAPLYPSASPQPPQVFSDHKPAIDYKRSSDRRGDYLNTQDALALLRSGIYRKFAAKLVISSSLDMIRCERATGSHCA